MRKAKIYVAAIPPVSKAFAEELARHFRPIEITPETDKDKIMFSAGEQKVIQFVLANATHREMSGDPAKLKSEQKKSLLSIILDKIKK